MYHRNPNHTRENRLKSTAGKEEAVTTGLIEVMRQTTHRPPFVSNWDAGLATPIDEALIHREVHIACNTLIMAVRNRVRRLGANVDRSFSRHFLGTIFAIAASSAPAPPVYDTQCGSKILCNTDILEKFLAKPLVTRWAFDVEHMARICATSQASSSSRLVTEVPVSAWRDVAAFEVAVAASAISLVDLLNIAYRRFTTHEE